MFRHHLLLKRKDRKKRRKENFEFEFFLVFFLDAIFCSLVFFVLLFVPFSLSLLLKY